MPFGIVLTSAPFTTPLTVITNKKLCNKIKYEIYIYEIIYLYDMIYIYIYIQMLMIDDSSDILLFIYME